jgi:hypothetical protein
MKWPERRCRPGREHSDTWVKERSPCPKVHPTAPAKPDKPYPGFPVFPHDAAELTADEMHAVERGLTYRGIGDRPGKV